MAQEGSFSLCEAGLSPRSQPRWKMMAGAGQTSGSVGGYLSVVLRGAARCVDIPRRTFPAHLHVLQAHPALGPARLDSGECLKGGKEMKPGSPAPASPPLHAGLGYGLCPCSVPHPPSPHSPGKPVCLCQASGPAWDLAEASWFPASGVMVTLSFPTVDTRGQSRTNIGHLPSQPHSHQ